MSRNHTFQVGYVFPTLIESSWKGLKLPSRSSLNGWIPKISVHLSLISVWDSFKQIYHNSFLCSIHKGPQMWVLNLFGFFDKQPGDRYNMWHKRSCRLHQIINVCQHQVAPVRITCWNCDGTGSFSLYLLRGWLWDIGPFFWDIGTFVFDFWCVVACAWWVS